MFIRQNLVQPNQSHSNISMMANSFIPWHTVTLFTELNLVSFAWNISYPTKINLFWGWGDGKYRIKNTIISNSWKSNLQLFFFFFCFFPVFVTCKIYRKAELFVFFHWQFFLHNSSFCDIRTYREKGMIKKLQPHKHISMKMWYLWTDSPNQWLCRKSQ